MNTVTAMMTTRMDMMTQRESTRMSMNIPPRSMNTITCQIFITGMGMRNNLHHAEIATPLK